MELRVVVCIKEFLLGRTQRVRGGGQLSEEVRVTSCVPQVSILGPLLFLAYVDDIWKKAEPTIILFADDCVMHRKTVNNNDLENLQIDLGRLGDWAVENGMKIKPGKSIAVSFVRARVKDPLKYPLLDQVIPQESSCKYSGIILRSHLTWTDHINCTAKEAWKALFFHNAYSQKRKQLNEKFSLRFTSASDSRVWSCVLGSVQGGTYKSFGPCSKKFELGNVGER